MADCSHMECPDDGVCLVWPARCPVCLGAFLRRKDGMVRYHGPHNNPCSGGGKPPAAEPPRTGVQPITEGADHDRCCAASRPVKTRT